MWILDFWTCAFRDLKGHAAYCHWRSACMGKTNCILKSSNILGYIGQLSQKELSHPNVNSAKIENPWFSHCYLDHCYLKLCSKRGFWLRIVYFCFVFCFFLKWHLEILKDTYPFSWVWIIGNHPTQLLLCRASRPDNYI